MRSLALILAVATATTLCSAEASLALEREIGPHVLVKRSPVGGTINEDGSLNTKQVYANYLKHFLKSPDNLTPKGKKWYRRVRAVDSDTAEMAFAEAQRYEKKEEKLKAEEKPSDKDPQIQAWSNLARSEPLNQLN